MSGKLRLLSDQLRISILERNRLLQLEVKPTDEDEEELQHSMATLLQGIRALDGNGTQYKTDTVQDEIAFLKREYQELAKLHGGEATQYKDLTIGVHVPYRDEPEIDREALLAERSRKSVRFTDTLADTEVSNDDLMQMQNQIMRNQDSSLEHLSASIGRQRELSMDIGNELDEHGELIEDINMTIDRSSGRLEHARERLSNFSRKAAGNSHLSTIVILIIVLVILLAIL